jgi:hypothetical protein
MRLVAAPLLLLSLATPLAAASTPGHAADSGDAAAIGSPADAAAVLYTLAAALDTHDQERVVAQFTADAHITDGAVYLGADGVDAWAREVLADDEWLDLQGHPEVGPTSGQPLPGDWAVAPVSISRVRYRGLQVDPQQATLVAIVQGTQIAYLSVRSDMLWARRFQDARAQQLVAAPSVPAAEPAERGNPQQLELPVDP